MLFKIKTRLKLIGFYVQIIHRKWILTAAHCVVSKVKIEVYLGAINRFSDGPGSYIKVIIVTNKRSMIPHESYAEAGFRNDIALIELPEEAPTENEYIGLVSLPRGSEFNRNLENVQGTVSGFGNKFVKLNDDLDNSFFTQF